MLLLDKALAEVSRIEASLNDYDLMVGAIASQMGQMKNQESFIQITNKNHGRLLSELETLVVSVPFGFRDYITLLSILQFYQ